MFELTQTLESDVQPSQKWSAKSSSTRKPDSQKQDESDLALMSNLATLTRLGGLAGIAEPGNSFLFATLYYIRSKRCTKLQWGKRQLAVEELSAK